MTDVLPLIVAAAISAPAALPAQGSSAKYHYVFTGHFWNGALVQANRTDVLTNASGTVELSKLDNASGTTTRSHGVLNADGTVSLADRNATSGPFAPYNSIALLVHDATTFSAGSKWSTSLAVQTGETATDVTRVPVAATVAKVDGDLVTLQAIGTGHGISTYGDYRDPIDLTIQVAARFRADELQRADYKATEYIHAGPLSQTMSWSWSLSQD